MTNITYYIPQSYYEASPEEIAKVCNGCGPGAWKFDFIPDFIWGVSIKFACDIHDWMYHIGGTKKDRRFADKMFLWNIEFCLLMGTKFPFTTLGNFRAWLFYYGLVRLRGHKHFNFQGTA